MSVPLALIAAIGQNGVIGADDRLPFRLPSDLKRFRALTLGKPLLMGRKTFESIGRPLPGRETIIVTRDPEFSVAASGVHVAYDLEAALALAQRRAQAMGADEVILAGGGDLYGALLPRVDRMYLTLIDLAPPGNVHFPQIDWSEWVERARTRPQPQPNDEASFAFVEFQRRKPAS